MSPELEQELLIWQLIVDKIATLAELELYWSLDDAYRALALMEYRQDSQEYQRQIAERNKPKVD